MRRLNLRLQLFLLLGLLWGQAGQPYVLVVSFDAFRPDYLHWVETPNFNRLAERGVLAKSLKSVFPTKTFPNHYALATGMYAEHHGIIANSFYDPEFDATYRIGDHDSTVNPRWYNGEPIWVTAEKQDVTTASFYWVGAEAPVGGVQPSIWKHYEHEFPFEARVDSVLSWFRLPEERRPHLVMLYFHEPDETSHRSGPRGADTWAVVSELDNVLGKLMTGLEQLDIYNQMNLIVLSDHGMTEISPERTIDLNEYANLKGIAQEGTGTFSFLYDGPKWRRQQAYKKLKKAPHLQVYWKNEIPERWHYRDNYRIKDMLLVAEEGWSILNKDKPEAGHYSGATHGYDNDLWSMQALFIADGPAFKDGYTRGTFENVNVYPIIAEILGIEPYEKIDGDVENVMDIFRE